MSRIFHLILCCCTGLLAGCVQYDYVGQKFPETENGKISFYERAKDVPREKLLLVGRMTMICDNSLDKYDIEDRLIAKAREYGADAVSLSSLEKVREGSVNNPVALEFPNSTVAPDGTDLYGDAYAVNSFGQEIAVSEDAGIDWIVRALFWKERKAAEEYLSKQRGKLKDNVIRIVKNEVKAPAEEKPAPLQK